MSIIWMLVVGLIVGVLARLILPGRESAFPEGALGWLLTAILGVVGAMLGGFIARTLWAGNDYTAGWIMSVIGAILVLLIVRFLFSGRTSTTV